MHELREWIQIHAIIYRSVSDASASNGAAKEDYWGEEPELVGATEQALKLSQQRQTLPPRWTRPSGSSSREDSVEAARELNSLMIPLDRMGNEAGKGIRFWV